MRGMKISSNFFKTVAKPAKAGARQTLLLGMSNG
jgi:hypothetical protein